MLFRSYFDLSIEKYELSSQYRYDLIIDNPQVAMYEVFVVVVESNQDFETLVNLSPSIGVFDSTVNLVPNQINIDKGFPRGILLSGISTTETIQLKVMVSWKDYYKIKQVREYFIVDIDFTAADTIVVNNQNEDNEDGE